MYTRLTHGIFIPCNTAFDLCCFVCLFAVVMGVLFHSIFFSLFHFPSLSLRFFFRVRSFVLLILFCFMHNCRWMLSAYIRIVCVLKSFKTKTKKSEQKAAVVAVSAATFDCAFGVLCCCCCCFCSLCERVTAMAAAEKCVYAENNNNNSSGSNNNNNNIGKEFLK